MKAIIMAGGEGTRLRPLTCDCPKPMMRLMNRPVMEYAVELLKKHDIRDIAVTLGYLPDAITDHFGDDRDFGVAIKYYRESVPLGTAGGVYQAREFLDDTFIVLSGDGVTDLDITDALRFHREKNALATLVLKKVGDPLEYGVVMTGNDHIIQGFIEKPDPSNVFSAAANTGIYILEPRIFDHIPPDRAYDFGSELFPKLVSEGQAVYGYNMDGYWCDIGDVNAYILAHVHAMEGKIRLSGLDQCNFCAGKAQIHPSAVIESPCMICEGAQIGPNAHIGPCSIIGPGCSVGEGASIKRSVLWSNAAVHPGAQARGCVMAAASRLGKGAQAYEGSVLGTGAHLGEGGVLLPGVKLWPGKETAPGAHITDNLIWGSQRKNCFFGGAFGISQPSQAMLAAQAHASLFKPRMLLLGRTDHPIANVMWHAAAAGAMTQGVQVMDGGVCTLPVLRHSMHTLGCDLAAMVSEDGFIPLESSGARLLSRQQRSLLNMYARQDFPKPLSTPPHAIIPESHGALSYSARVCRRFAADPRQAPDILLYSPSRYMTEFAEGVLKRTGLNVRTVSGKSRFIPAGHEIGLWLSPFGESFSLSDGEGPLSEPLQQLFLSWVALNSGIADLILPVSATRSIRLLADATNASVEYVGGEPALWQSVLAEKYPEQFILHFDALQSALWGLSTLIARGLSLAEWKALMPQTCRQKRRISASADAAGHILESFAREVPDPQLDCGIRFTRNGAWAWICPDESCASFQIVTESASAETARELCDFCESRIGKLLKK